MVKPETAKRIRSAGFLIAVGLMVGCVLGLSVRPAADASDAPGGHVGLATHAEDMGGHHHHDDSAGEHHEEEEHHEEHDEEDHHDIPEPAPVPVPVPQPRASSRTHRQNGKQSWANPEHRETYQTMYNEYHKLRSGSDVCHSCRFLDGIFKIYKFKTLLDAGCGTAVMVRKLRQKGIDARGIEAASLPLQEYAKDLLANGTVYSVPMQEIPFKTSQFDMITSVEVFEHIPEADIDRSINELSRVAKLGATAFITVGQSTSRFDTKEGRQKSAVAAISTQFKFHETIKPRQWWLDTFCAHGFYEDPKAYLQMVKMANEGGLSRPPPRGWFSLVKAKPGSRPCKCVTPLNRPESWFCGTQGRASAKRDVQKLWAELRKDAQ